MKMTLFLLSQEWNSKTNYFVFKVVCTCLKLALTICNKFSFIIIFNSTAIATFLDSSFSYENQSMTWDFCNIEFVKWQMIAILIQWNLNLRKILGVTKIFLKSRFFLIPDTRKPLKEHNFAKWTSETIQMSYCSIIVK